MEPRPPRPRGPQPGIPGMGAPAGAPLSGYPYAPEGAAAAAPPSAVPLAGEPLLPRGQRRRQGAWRGLVAGLLGLAAIGALAWMLRDRIIPPSTPTTPQAAIQVAPASPAAIVGGTPTTAPAAANLLSTATPTPSPPARPTAAPTATPTPQPTEPPADAAGDGAILPLVDLLPDAAALPAGLVEAGTGERSKGDVVLSLAGDDPVVEAEADQLLADWGWEGNAFRDFGPATAEGAPSGLTNLNVSIHRFADDASADDAMIFFSDRVVAAQGLVDVAVEPLGDAVRGLAGAPEGAPIAVLYVRDGNTMYRIGGATAAESGADPLPPLVEAATAILAQ